MSAPSLAVALVQDPRAEARQPAAVGLAQRPLSGGPALRLAGTEGVVVLRKMEE